MSELLGVDIKIDKKAEYLWSGNLKPGLPPLYSGQESWSIWTKDGLLIFAQPKEPIKLVTPSIVKHVVDVGPIGIKVIKMLVEAYKREQKSAYDNAYPDDGGF